MLGGFGYCLLRKARQELRKQEIMALTGTRFGILVKGANGRKWFRTDTASCGDTESAEMWLAAYVDDWSPPGLKFKIGVDDELKTAPIAPNHYRPWDTTADE